CTSLVTIAGNDLWLLIPVENLAMALIVDVELAVREPRQETARACWRLLEHLEGSDVSGLPARIVAVCPRLQGGGVVGVLALRVVLVAGCQLIKQTGVRVHLGPDWSIGECPPRHRSEIEEVDEDRRRRARLGRSSLEARQGVDS